MEKVRKKILYVITKSNMGGAQRYVFDLATHLPRDTYEVAVAQGGKGTNTPEKNSLGDTLEHAGIRTIPVEGFVRDVSPLRDISTLFELVTLFRRERPDVVHLNSAKAVALGALAARIARVPRIISTIHGWSSNEPRPWWQRLLIRSIERFGIMLAHETIVVCAHDKRQGTTVIHNGIVPPRVLLREEARRHLSLPHDAFVVGTIGELNRNKNQRMLIEAFAALPSTHTVLAIIGEGEERARLEEHIRSHPPHDIRLLGYKENVAQFLKALDVFVLPSEKEGLPYALLEAGAAGIPIVATKVGGVPEIITQGHSGYLIDKGDTQALSSGLSIYLKNSGLGMMHSETLRQHISSTFALTTMVARTVRHYDA
jgi:glycosyltransferase involved in cell wall biosynthesis